MNFKKVLISELIPDAGNPRKDLKPEDPEYQQIKRSIEEFGDLEPIVFNTRTRKIVGGHQRLKVFREHGLENLFVVEAGAYSWAFAEDDLKELTPEKEKAANLALNKIGGSWDFSQVSIWLSELKEADFDISITGFSDEELRRIDENLFGENLGESFTLPNGDKNFTTISFTLTEEQAAFIKLQINAAKKRIGEPEGDNKNGNGNALYLVVSEWSAQKK